MHQFDHDVDELKGWMSEKEVVLDSDDHDHDLLSIQALIRQHEGLEVQYTTKVYLTCLTEMVAEQFHCGRLQRFTISLAIQDLMTCFSSLNECLYLGGLTAGYTNSPIK